MSRLILVLSIIAAVMFLFVGGAKLAGVEDIVDNLENNLNVPGWAIPVIGALEAIGAVAILFPKTRFWAAAGLTAITFGAVLTHLINADWAGWPMAFVLGLLAGFIAWKTMPDSVRARIGAQPA